VSKKTNAAKPPTAAKPSTAKIKSATNESTTTCLVREIVLDELLTPKSLPSIADTAPIKQLIRRLQVNIGNNALVTFPLLKVFHLFSCS
jgi:hypothetical protein